MEPALYSYKISLCVLLVFSMLIKNLECMHGCNMEDFPPCSTRVMIEISEFLECMQKIQANLTRVQNALEN